MPDTILPAASDTTRIEADIAQWLSRFALDSGDEAALLGGFADRLLEAGLPVLRLGIGYIPFHPVLEGRGLSWRRGPPAGVEQNVRLSGDTSVLDGSPFARLTDHRQDELRRTVGSTYRPGEFSLLDRFVAEGATDYLVLSVRFGAGSMLGAIPGMLLSVQTDRPGGFTAAEVALLRRLAIPYAHAQKTMMSIDAGRVLMRTYLGQDPARRVLDGTIRRGVAETTSAVLWSSDLVGFTRIADSVARAQLMPLLNDYADAVVGAVTDHGGEVLKFIGDGILAIFPFGGDASGRVVHAPGDGATVDPTPACVRALDAAEAAMAAVATLSARRAATGQPRTGLHLALHVGEVLYGNIGSRERLDFTVIGPAVNELARIEGMGRTLDQPLVASEAFGGLSATARARLVSLGRYALRGVRKPQELFTLDPATARGMSPV